MKRLGGNEKLPYLCKTKEVNINPSNPLVFY
jgi:hypothetical protein